RRRLQRAQTGPLEDSRGAMRSWLATSRSKRRWKLAVVTMGGVLQGSRGDRLREKSDRAVPHRELGAIAMTAAEAAHIERVAGAHRPSRGKGGRFRRWRRPIRESCAFRAR